MIRPALSAAAGDGRSAAVREEHATRRAGRAPTGRVGGVNLHVLGVEVGLREGRAGRHHTRRAVNGRVAQKLETAGTGPLGARVLHDVAVAALGQGHVVRPLPGRVPATAGGVDARARAVHRSAVAEEHRPAVLVIGDQTGVPVEVLDGRDLSAAVVGAGDAAVGVGDGPDAEKQREAGERGHERREQDLSHGWFLSVSAASGIEAGRDAPGSPGMAGWVRCAPTRLMLRSLPPSWPVRLTPLQLLGAYASSSLVEPTCRFQELNLTT
jgi:hypothetical protein